MRLSLRLLILLLLLGPLAAAPAMAAAPAVAASILPVHSLTAALLQGVGEPHLVVPPNASPHAYALRPSEARALADAQLVVWIGPEMEAALVRPVRSLGGKARVLTLQEAPGLHTLAPRADRRWGGHEHHAGHAHGGIDAHLWLDPRNAAGMARAIAQVLTEIDPGNAARYRANLAQLEARLAQLDARLAARLAPLRDTPYLVFHDAYQYLEARYGLRAVGAVTLSPERPPGARHLRDLRAELKRGGARCVFAEPQFDAALVDTLTEGTAVRRGVLDPLGVRLTPGPEAYFTLMEGLAAGLEDCLRPR